MREPIFSVVIPSYNAIDFLPAAFASVHAQEIEDFEILVLDDGSTDGSGEWLAESSRMDPRIRVFKGGRLGPARARNLLIENAKSEIIAFLDADDTWLPGKLRAEIDFHLANPDVAFTFTDYRHVDMAGRLRSTAFEFWKPGFAAGCGKGFTRLRQPLANLMAINVVGTSCVVAKRESLRNANGFAAGLPSAEDWDLWLRLAETGAVAFSTEVTMHYLMRPGSETANREARIRAMEQIIDRFGGSAVPGWARRAARSRLMTSKAQYAMESGRRVPAAGNAFGAFLLQPSRRGLIEFAARLRDLTSARQEDVKC